MVKKGKPKFLPRATPAGFFHLRSGVAEWGGGERGGREGDRKVLETHTLHTKNGAGPRGTKWEKIFFTSGSAAQLKIHEKSG